MPPYDWFFVTTSTVSHQNPFLVTNHVYDSTFVYLVGIIEIDMARARCLNRRAQTVSSSANTGSISIASTSSSGNVASSVVDTALQNVSILHRFLSFTGDNPYCYLAAINYAYQAECLQLYDMQQQPTATVSSSSSFLTTDTTNDGNIGGNVDVALVAEATIQNTDILRHILSFVGDNQYRFVASINQTFKAGYLQLYKNNRQTYYNFSTIEHADICMEEQDTEDQNIYESHILCNRAARHGCVLVLMYLQLKGCPWDVSTCNSAAKYGHLHILQYLRAHGCPWDVVTCEKAAEYGHLHILQYLHANGCRRDGYESESLLGWAERIGCPWDEDICIDAAFYGRLEVLQRARGHGCPWNELVFTNAAVNGHLEVLQWARANGCQWDEETCRAAAGNGEMAVLQWARENGCPWDESTCTEAAKFGQLEVLQWARSTGCPWDESTGFYAAARGHLEVLQWAIAEGCPHDEHTWEDTALRNQVAVLQWARDMGFRND
jgi:hypothetical protein